MKSPKVSIVVPVYNGEKYIRETIQSVKRQTEEDWELLLIDDVSTDKSLEVIEEYVNDQIHLIRLAKNSGAAAARNRGIKEAKGKYLAFLDADDIWDEKKLTKQLLFMEEKGCAFSYTGYEFADSEGVSVEKIVRVPRKLNYGQALKNTTIFTSTVMFDLEKISKDMVEMPLVPSEDTATWWKVLRSGYEAYGLNEALTLYRRSKGTLSSNKKTAIWRIWNLYRREEKLSIPYSAFCFCFYAVHAVLRRI